MNARSSTEASMWVLKIQRERRNIQKGGDNIIVILKLGLLHKCTLLKKVTL